MSCWHWTVVLRIPASALGFKSVREWNEFLGKHDDELQPEEDCFDQSCCETYPYELGWKGINIYDPDRQLDQRDPRHPDIVPGPFLDYYIRDDYPIEPGEFGYSDHNEVMELSRSEKEEYLPEFQKLFPHFSLEDMDAVCMCEYVWYDGTDAPYLYL